MEVHLYRLWKHPPIQIGAADDWYLLHPETNDARLTFSNIINISNASELFRCNDSCSSAWEARLIRHDDV